MLARPELPSIWFDTVRFSTRKEEPSEPGLGFLFFFHALPGADIKRYEVGRFVSTPKTFKEMVKVICRLLDFYPEREQPKPDK